MLNAEGFSRFRWCFCLPFRATLSTGHCGRRMTMDEESIFHLALEKVGSERAAFLAENCVGDDECRRRMELLLEAHDKTDGFLLDVPPAGLNVAIEQLV